MPSDNNSFELYAFNGQIGSGKNYVAQHIFWPLLDNKPTLIVAFADHFKVEMIVKEGYERSKVFGTKDEHTRKGLLRRGTEKGRNVYGDDIWINHLHEWMVEYNNRGIERFIISDLRFENEFEYVKSMGGECIRIIAPKRHQEGLIKERGEGNDSDYNHIAETSYDALESANWDLIINNDPEHDTEEQIVNYLKNIQ